MEVSTARDGHFPTSPLLSTRSSRQPLGSAGVALLAYFAEIFTDNAFARVKWQVMFKSTWVFTLMAGVSNLIIIHYVLRR